MKSRIAAVCVVASMALGVASTAQAQARPTHVHKFQQVYFETEGETTVEYGLLTYKLPKYSLVVIQPGVVHTNRNDSTAVERHVTLLMPQLTNGEPADIEYERVDRPAQAPGQAPAGGGRGRGAATP